MIPAPVATKKRRRTLEQGNIRRAKKEED
ncbi:hypothetical protein RSAG8_12600, partial [Rhizoctonia solani AG-8 WAC10335]